MLRRPRVEREIGIVAVASGEERRKLRVLVDKVQSLFAGGVVDQKTIPQPDAIADLFSEIVTYRADHRLPPVLPSPSLLPLPIDQDQTVGNSGVF
jgi:hypothetical protein